ncbi:MAG: ABC-2 family transporter protein [Methanocella sp. PtaU1.Bin125]|nr:MAG: ABC-2 family transporter protein [Methanocella sp. PtaU1.Bin125]
MPAKNLKPVENLGWTAGLRNMLKKENAKWWNWKSLAVQLIVWTVIVNSLVAMMVFALPQMPIPEDAKQQINQSGDAEAMQMLNFTPEVILDLGLSIFFQVAGIALLIGSVILAHDSILKERESGTAAWLLSKPISRKAFVLSKLVANVIGLLLIVIAVQAAIAYAQISIATGGLVSIPSFLGGVGIMTVNSLFYLVLALVLGAFTLNRGVTLGLPIVVGIVGSFLLQFVSELQYVTPWALGSMALAMAEGLPMPDWVIFPIVATVLWTLAFAGAAVWKFERTEL